MRRGWLRWTLFWMWIAAAAAPVDAQVLPGTSSEARDEALAAVQRGEAARAEAILREALEDSPEDPWLLYDLAAVNATQGDLESASQRLVEAVQHGFVDFHEMTRDTRMAPLREHETYRTIIAGWRRILDARADANMASAKRVFGGGYTYERSPELRLLFASAFRERSFEDARREIERIAAWAHEHLFEEPDPQDPRPSAWVTVVLPTPEDFLVFMNRLGAGSKIGGLYDDNRKQLICRDIGPSLRHEFFHVLHWRLLHERGQRHPDWIMEGLGSLVEDMDRSEAEASDGGSDLAPAPSWRTNIAKRLVKIGSLTPWRRLMTMEAERFRARRANARYAEARAIMLFLWRRGVLGDWFRTYVDHYADDPSGIAALERTFGEDLETIEDDFRAWLRALPEVAEEIRPGMASLGVVVTAGRGDGPRIDEIVAGTAAGGSGLHMGDVILSIDGRPTRTLPDLVRVLSDYEVGDEVVIEARRGRRRLTARLTLTAR